MPECCCQKPAEREPAAPCKLVFSWRDYVKLVFAWLFNYRKTFAVEPGLYYTGDSYSADTPLLVTGNYHMTVFILWRILKKRNIRLLVIDTRGINVWCSSGKGRFSAAEIGKQLDRYAQQTLAPDRKITLILPKLSLSGVSLAELKKQQLIPRIGPIYAKDLPAYLDNPPLRDCREDVYRFDLADRLFTLGPSLVQVLRYGLYAFIPLFIWHYFYPTGIHWQILPLLTGIAVSYVVLFPLLPTHTFAVKALGLFALLAAGLVLYYLFLQREAFDLLTLLFYLFFLAGASLFYALYYTGNSGVSNYSLVKREIITFLPLTALCLLGSAVIIVLKGVLS